ncbi:exodeoxyribonuclease I [Actinotalea ferrariae CF5-4]|uniref:Nuclease SbcCD subunit D n=1 Tax=Actinotalea ferrariae CF5-4 TaxID=948458 RepID=A0A021VU98_9CELL|nr:exonuclease SbcCD subunit D [Actinotalea ferrariae]EYR62647.1 exodeoxyribonuclease I [Actinotalea ferrariae CF5-4]
MRILHTSDWHLGRTLHGVDLLAHQAAYLDHLVELAGGEQVDAVVVSGDVYDRAVPPVEAVTLLSEALARLAATTTVVLTPGNHDSAVRLGFGADLLRSGVHVRARVADVGTPVELADEHGPVLVHALPYLDPDATRHVLADGDPTVAPGELLPRSHEAVMAAALRRVRADLAARAAQGDGRPRSVVMAHAFVVGGEASDSERDIRVGGVDSVPAGVFGGVDYVALGHLHGAQRIAAGRGVPGEGDDGDGDGVGGAAPGGAEAPAPPVLQYSGSPLAYSFSELRQRKATVLVDLGPEGVRRTELVPAPVPRRLAEVTGRLEDLLGAAGEPHRDDWLRVVVTDDARPTELVARVKARFPHALVVEHRPVAATERVRARAVTSASDPLLVAGEFVEHVTGAPPTPEELAVLRRAYEDVLAAGRSA